MNNKSKKLFQLMNINILIYPNPLKCYKMNKKPSKKNIIILCANNKQLMNIFKQIGSY